MITQVKTEKMVIFSDLHLGNPFSHVSARTVRFLEEMSTQGYDICINGDGFEVAQVSFARLAAEVPPVLHAIKECARRGSKVYYVVGNHDIVFEHFLSDWGSFALAPFLNIESGKRRLRVEHGHLYDPFFVRYPRLYEWCTWLGGVFLHVSPSFYKLWIAWERWRGLQREKKGIRGEPQAFYQAAQELADRGFDTVIFGHTHHAGQVQAKNWQYFNAGSWMLEPSYVKIEQGKVELCRYGSP